MWPLNVAAFVMSEDNIIVKASGPQVYGESNLTHLHVSIETLDFNEVGCDKISLPIVNSSRCGGILIYIN